MLKHFRKEIEVKNRTQVTPALVPRWWLDELMLDEGDKIIMTVSDDGNLVISPMQDKDMTPDNPDSKITSDSCNCKDRKNPELRT